MRVELSEDQVDEALEAYARELLGVKAAKVITITRVNKTKRAVAVLEVSK